MTRLSFNDYDSVMDTSTNSVEKINAPKSIERLEEISTARAIQRRLDEEMEDDEDRIKIHSEPIDLTGFDVLDDIGRGSSNVLMDDPILDFEEL